MVGILSSTDSTSVLLATQKIVTTVRPKNFEGLFRCNPNCDYNQKTVA